MGWLRVNSPIAENSFNNRHTLFRCQRLTCITCGNTTVSLYLSLAVSTRETEIETKMFINNNVEIIVEMIISEMILTKWHQDVKIIKSCRLQHQYLI